MYQQPKPASKIIVEVLEELTEDLPNHTYCLNADGKMVAYAKVGTQDYEYFSKPLSFSKKLRKFKKLDIRTCKF